MSLILENVTLPKYSYPFEVESFLSTWWTTVAPKYKILSHSGQLVAHKKTVFKNLVPLKELRFASWDMPPSELWTQDKASQLIEYFQKKAPWDYFHMVFIENEYFFKDIEDIKEKTKINPTIIPGKPEYSVSFTNGWEGYLQELSYKNRKDFRRKFKKAGILAPDLRVVESCLDLDEFLDRFFKYHEQYWTEKVGYSQFSERGYRNFWRTWLKIQQEEGKLRLHNLYLNGELANMNISFVEKDQWYWQFTINTGSYLDYYPGIIAFYLLLERVANEGYKTFRTGPGEIFYKKQAANLVEKRYELIIPNPESFIGKKFVQHLLKRMNFTNGNEHSK